MLRRLMVCAVALMGVALFVETVDAGHHRGGNCCQQTRCHKVKHHRGGCNTGCNVGCGQVASCGAPVASCGVPAATCCAPAAATCNTGCNTGCTAGAYGTNMNPVPVNPGAGGVPAATDAPPPPAETK